MRTRGRTLSSAEWVDGRVTAGHQSAQAKDNLQIPEGHPAASEIGDMILTALGQNPLFISAALPMKVFPPLFNSYGGGQSFGTHIDNAIRHVKGSSHRVRSDLSATLFSHRRKITTAVNWSSRIPTGPLGEAAARTHGGLSVVEPASG